jgi:hypothetical protein
MSREPDGASVAMADGDMLRCARLATRSLAEAVETAFGPQPREKLLVSAVGRVLITSSGASILQSLVTEPAESPVARYIIDCALGHAESAGEGATAFILMADAALRSIEAVLAPLPPARRRAEQSRLAHELAVLGCHTLPAVLEPDWRLACLAVPLRSLDPPAVAGVLRRVGLAIVGTSLGAAFSASASAAVCSSLVEALLPEEEEGEAGQRGGAAGEPAAALGVWRIAQARAGGGVAVVGAAGAAVNSSTAQRGLMLRARRIDETGMPQSRQAAGVLFLGPRALPPDAPGGQQSHQPATLRVRSAPPAALPVPVSRQSDVSNGGASLQAAAGVDGGMRVRTGKGMASSLSADADAFSRTAKNSWPAAVSPSYSHCMDTHIPTVSINGRPSSPHRPAASAGSPPPFSSPPPFGL